MGVSLRIQGGFLYNLASLLRYHCVPTAVLAVLLRCLYYDIGVSTEVALRCQHGDTAGIFCGRHRAALLPQQRRSSTAVAPQ